MDRLDQLKAAMEQQGFGAGDMIVVLSAYNAFNPYLEGLGLTEALGTYRSPLAERANTPCVLVSYHAHLRSLKVHITKEDRGLVLVAADEYGISGPTLRSRMILTLNTTEQNLRDLFRELLSRDVEQHMG